MGGAPNPGYDAGGPPGYGPGWQRPPEQVGPAPGVTWASPWARLGAYLVDGLIVGIVLTAVLVVVFGVLFGTAFADLRADEEYSEAYLTGRFLGPILLVLPIVLVLSILSMGYFVVGWAKGGQTIGMKLAGIRVVRDRDGGRIGWGEAVVRLIGYWVSGAVMYLGFVWILIDARRRGWHDLLAGTCVIADRR